MVPVVHFSSKQLPVSIQGSIQQVDIVFERRFFSAEKFYPRGLSDHKGTFQEASSRKIDELSFLDNKKKVCTTTASKFREFVNKARLVNILGQETPKSKASSGNMFNDIDIF